MSYSYISYQGNSANIPAIVVIPGDILFYNFTLVGYKSTRNVLIIYAQGLIPGFGLSAQVVVSYRTDIIIGAIGQKNVCYSFDKKCYTSVVKKWENGGNSAIFGIRCAASNPLTHACLKWQESL